MDAKDQKILSLLQADATLSLADIAARVHLSQTPCWKRIQRLEAAGVIVCRAAILAPEKVGLNLVAYVTVEVGDHTEAGIDAFAEKVAAMPEVIDFYRMAGDVDFILKVMLPDMAAYQGFYKRLVALISLKNVTSRFAMERIKCTTQLPLPAALNTTM